MRKILGIIVYKTDEKFRIKEAKAVERITKVAVEVFLCAFIFSCIFLAGSINNVVLSGYIKSLSGYSVYQVHSGSQDMLSKKYPPQSAADEKNNLSHCIEAYLGDLQNQYGIKVIVCHQIIYGYDGYAKTVTYARPMDMNSSWEDLRIPLKEGRYFEGDEDAVIVLKGDYHIGDIVTISNENGKMQSVSVVGVSILPMLPQNEFDLMYYGDTFYGLTVNKDRDAKAIFFLNPNSKLNNPKNEINYHVLVKSDNPLAIKELKENGMLVPVERAVKKNRNRLIRAAIYTIVSGLLLFMSIAFMDYCEWKKGRGFLFAVDILVGTILGWISTTGVGWEFVSYRANFFIVLLIAISFVIVFMLFSKRYFLKFSKPEEEEPEDFEKVSLTPENYKEHHTNWEE